MPAARCPRCGSDRLVFDITGYQVGTGPVVGVDEYGQILVDMYVGDPDRFTNPTLNCDDCGHSWRTKRDWKPV